MSNDMCAAVVEADAAIDAEFDSSCDYELLSCTCGVASWPRARFEYLSYLACKLHCILEDHGDQRYPGRMGSGQGRGEKAQPCWGSAAKGRDSAATGFRSVVACS